MDSCEGCILLAIYIFCARSIVTTLKRVIGIDNISWSHSADVIATIKFQSVYAYEVVFKYFLLTIKLWEAFLYLMIFPKMFKTA